MDDRFITQWDRWASSMCHLATAIIAEGAAEIEKQSVSQPAPLAVQLLSRTLSNFIGVQVLLKAELVVEARVLVRCCYENLFWLVGLHEEGDKFALLMGQDQSGSARNLMQFALGQGAELTAEVRARLQAALSHVAKNWPKPGKLTAKGVAEKGAAKGAYLVYSQLSADAAHPSLLSLSRHVRRYDPAGGHLIDVSPCPKQAEIVQTYQLAANAMLGACVALNDILGHTTAGYSLAAFADAYDTLFGGMEPVSDSK
jgi:hypothetical protein